MRDHVVSWFDWAQDNKLDIDMEEFILVTGCTLVTSWAAAVFVDDNMEAEISLADTMFNSSGSRFVLDVIQGPVEHRNSFLNRVRSPGYAYSACTDFLLYGKEPDQCVFIRGFRVKRTSFGTRVMRAVLDTSEARRKTRTQKNQLSYIRKVS